MNKVEQLMEELFSGRKQTQELLQMRSEMTANCADRFSDLLRDGLSEAEAIARLREDLNGVEELLGESAPAAQGFRSVCVESTAVNVWITQGDALSVIQRNEDGTEEECRYASVQEETLCVKMPAFSIGTWLFSSGIHVSPCDVLLTLPNGCYESVSVKTVSGDISAYLSCRTLKAESRSGDIKIQGETDERHLRSTSGDILSQGTGKSVTVETNSGDVWVQGHADTVRLKTISGDALCDGVCKRGEILSVSGDVTANLSGEMIEAFEIHTTSGDGTIHFASAPQRMHVL